MVGPPCTIHTGLCMQHASPLLFVESPRFPSPLTASLLPHLSLSPSRPPQTPSRSAWLQATQPNKRPAAHAAEVEGPLIDPASSFIRRVIGEMDVEGGGRPAVQLQSTTKRAASSPWVRKLSFMRFHSFDSENLSLCSMVSQVRSSAFGLRRN